MTTDLIMRVNVRTTTTATTCLQQHYVTPVAYEVILAPGIIGRQLRGFESTRVHTRINSLFVGTFSCAQIDLRKARERESATLGEKSTSSGIAEPYARQKLKARTGGEKGRHL